MTDITREDKSYCESYKELLFYEVRQAMEYIRRGNSETAKFFVNQAQGSIDSMLELLEMAGKEK